MSSKRHTVCREGTPTDAPQQGERGGTDQRLGVLTSPLARKVPSRQDRLTRDEMLAGVARLMAERSTCERAQVGAVIARGGRIIGSGYGGSPSKTPHCIDVGCEVENGHCVRTLHAEAAAISFAARTGVALEGATMYVTHQPCRECAKLIINSGIAEVVYEYSYGTDEGTAALYHAGVKIRTGKPQL